MMDLRVKDGDLILEYGRMIIFLDRGLILDYISPRKSAGLLQGTRLWNPHGRESNTNVLCGPEEWL